jgi:polysaccharide export outer membrane protein
MHRLVLLLLPSVMTLAVIGCGGRAVRYPEPIRPDPAVEPAVNAELARLNVPPPIEPARFQPGDRLTIDVYGEDDLRVFDAPVKLDGTIDVPLLGSVVAAGKTTDELKVEIEAGLATWLRVPRAAVIATAMTGPSVTVLGIVNEPGVQPIQRPLRLMDAIAAAGGVKTGLFRSSTVDLADFSGAYVARSGRVLPVDFQQLFRERDFRHNIFLRPGDVVYIPSALSREIWVLGEVNAPRAYSYRGAATLVQVLTHAGGMTDQARASEVRLIRGGMADPELFVINIDEVMEGRASDLALQPGDIVFVPKTPLAEWNTIVKQILPTLEGAARGVYIAGAVGQ